MKEREIITLCGSTKFKETFEEINKQLTAQGKIVLSVGVFGHSLTSEEKATFFSEDVKKELDLLHFDKIDMSNSIYVINQGGYIGDSTKKEIEYAQKKGKNIYYLES